MSLLDWFNFCIGDAAAIERFAGNPWTLVIGALFVFSAGLARNHDVHDLVAQSWRLALPFAASTLAAALLYGVLWLVASDSLLSQVPPWSLLGLFWSTAPLAWLYGLPYERIWPKDVAADRRRAALVIVSVLRVALMTRCVVVLGRGDIAVSLAIVASFLAPMAALALLLTEALVRDPEERLPPDSLVEQLRRTTTKLGDGMAMIPTDDKIPPVNGQPGELEITRDMPVGVALGCTVPILIAAILLLAGVALRSRWQPAEVRVAAEAPTASMWAFAFTGNAFWLTLTCLRQPAQRRRSAVVRRLQTGPLDDVLRDLDLRTPADFPPHWDPAGVLARKPHLARFLDAVQASRNLPPTSWVRATFALRFERVLPRFFDDWHIWLYQDNRATDAQLHEIERLHDLLASWPAAAPLLAPQCDYLEKLIEFTRQHDSPRSLVLERIRALGGDATPPSPRHQ